MRILLLENGIIKRNDYSKRNIRMTKEHKKASTAKQILEQVPMMKCKA
jgi:hypothetical protein